MAKTAAKAKANGKTAVKSKPRTNWRDPKTIALLRLIVSGKLTPEQVSARMSTKPFPGHVRDRVYMLKRGALNPQGVSLHFLTPHELREGSRGPGTHAPGPRHSTLAMTLRYARLTQTDVSAKFRRASPLHNLRMLMWAGRILGLLERLL
jgi:hypothetical protein